MSDFPSLHSFHHWRLQAERGCGWKKLMAEAIVHEELMGETAMIRIDIPQRGITELHHAVFDVNGTLAVDGKPVPGVVGRLKALGEHLSLHALTAGTHGNIAELERVLGFPLHLIVSGEEKMRYVEQLG